MRANLQRHGYEALVKVPILDAVLAGVGADPYGCRDAERESHGKIGDDALRARFWAQCLVGISTVGAPGSDHGRACF